MPYAELPSGLKVHYDQAGTGPDLVLIHGLLGNLANWHFKIVPLLWNDYHIVTYDLRGHGKTPMTETGYSPTQLATDLKDLLDVLGVRQASVVGHSFGADIALYFAFLYPERVNKVVLIEPLIPALVAILTREDFEGKGWAADMIQKFGIRVADERRLDDEYLLNQFLGVDTNRWGPAKGLPRPRRHQDWAVKLFTTTSVLRDAIEIGDLTLEAIPTIQAPVHLIYDEASLFWHKSFAYLRDHLPNATYTLLKSDSSDIPHFAPLEKPDLTARLIREGLELKHGAVSG